MIASAAEQALVPSAAYFYIGHNDQRLRAHLGRVSTPSPSGREFQGRATTMTR